jgi:hypothetical protein
VVETVNKFRIKLRGDMKDTTPYFVYMNNNARFLQLCSANYTSDDFEHLTEIIYDNYKYDMYLDNLPAIVRNSWYVPGNTIETYGVPVGRYDSHEDSYMYYNHFHIEVEINPDIDNEHYFRVVGFRVEPLSCGHQLIDDSDLIEDDQDL